MSTIYLDVTDYVEFLTRSESPSGVQRVVAEVSTLLMASHAAESVWWQEILSRMERRTGRTYLRPHRH